MMLPILISVSDAPVSYFFWANAAPEVRVMTAVAVTSAAVRSVLSKNNSGLLGLINGLSVLSEPADELLAHDRDLPRAVRHEVDDGEQEYAEYGAGEALGDALRHVRHEDDESCADERAGQPADATDDHAEEQRDRQRDRVAVGRDELHGDGAKRAGNAGDAGGHAEGQRLVQRDVDAHRGGRDLVVADRHEGAARTRAQQVHRGDVNCDPDRQREIIEPHVLRQRQAERSIRLGDDETLHAAGPVLEIAELEQL